ncbi:hypothetical protein M426DRAFT_322315 [Hypoxylon sp. CI-4A]|nr:hypothetical protein M426DRAFT_322315 [Hypoxylon sp. CI-4A]
MFIFGASLSAVALLVLFSHLTQFTKTSTNLDYPSSSSCAQASTSSYLPPISYLVRVR